MPRLRILVTKMGRGAALQVEGSRRAAKTCRINLRNDEVVKDPSKPMEPHAFSTFLHDLHGFSVSIARPPRNLA